METLTNRDDVTCVRPKLTRKVEFPEIIEWLLETVSILYQVKVDAALNYLKIQMIDRIDEAANEPLQFLFFSILIAIKRALRFSNYNTFFTRSEKIVRVYLFLHSVDLNFQGIRIPPPFPHRRLIYSKSI